MTYKECRKIAKEKNYDVEILDDWNEERTKLIELLTTEHQKYLTATTHNHTELTCPVCRYLKELEGRRCLQ